jgi:hypothetical protein
MPKLYLINYESLSYSYYFVLNKGDNANGRFLGYTLTSIHQKLN